MKCSSCQFENPSQAKFCQECGRAITLECSQCGTRLPAQAKFCIECGAPSNEPEKSATGIESPDSYTPRHLAERIMADRPALEGERKQVTVLFADIKGSTEMVDGQDPEDADNLLNPVLSQMMDAVHRFEGTVTRITGDGIMALFGAPLALEDHAVRACFAALTMQKTIRQHSPQFRRQHGVSLFIRVGLNSGTVVVRSIGNDLYMEYTAMGETTHLAARMEQLADPGCVLLSANTRQLAEGYVDTESLGRIPVKGLAEPVEVYELTSAGFTRRRFEAAAMRGLCQFVGRTAEMGALQNAMSLASEQQGQVVGVIGEAAVGKSRLFYEFTRCARSKGWSILETHAASIGGNAPLYPLREILKACFQIEMVDEPSTVLAKITAKLERVEDDLARFVPAFLALFEISQQDSRWHALDPLHRRQQTFDACRMLLLNESRMQPLILVFEDLHWIDSETQAFLDQLVAGLTGAAVLLLVNYRPEYQHAWGNLTCYTQVHLDPLPPENAGELLDSLVGRDAGMDRLRQRLISQTLGNPFFLEESVRSLVETGTLTGSTGAYVLNREAREIEVPATVQAVLAARMDRLPGERKVVLQTAAVIGETFSFDLLRQLIELPDEELRRSLTNLQSMEFVYETQLFPDLEFTFKHRLTHQVAYQSLLKQRRRGLHRKTLQIMEQLYEGRVPEFVDQMAHHAYQGERWSKALSYLRQAGHKAEGRSAYQEAVDCFERAMKAIERLPQDRRMIEQAVDVYFDLRTSLFPLGRHERVADCLNHAESLCSKLDDRIREAWVAVYMCHYHWLTGQAKAAVSLGRRAHELANRLDDLSLSVTVNYYLGLACLSSGSYGDSIACLKRNVETLRGDQNRQRFGVAGFPAAMSRSYLAWALAEQGNFPAAYEAGREALRQANELDHSWTCVTTAWGLAQVSIIRQDHERSIEDLERALDRCIDRKLEALTPGVMGTLGYVYTMTGRQSDGLAKLNEALKAAESSGRLAFHGLMLLYYAETLMRMDRFGEAGDSAYRCLELARQRGELGIEAWAHKLLADIDCRCPTGSIEQALRSYQAARDLAQRAGMQPLLAHCYHGAGHVRQRAGEYVAAREHLLQALGRYQEMQMVSGIRSSEELLDQNS